MRTAARFGSGLALESTVQVALDAIQCPRVSFWLCWGRSVSKSTEDTVRRIEEASASGDYEGLDQLLDEDVRFYLPGQSPFAGTYRGINEVVSMFKSANAHRSQHPLTVRALSLSS